MTKRIVVPLDMSEVAEAAIPVAKGLATRLGLPVTLVSVLEVPAQFGARRQYDEPRGAVAERIPRDAPISTASPFGRWSGWSNAEPSERQVNRVAAETAEAERYLRSVADRFGDLTVEVTVQYGSPAEGILHTAERRENSCIVLASHGRSGIGRAILGSVATRVAQAATSPVFVVRTDAELPDSETYDVRSVLAAVDGSGFSEYAVSAALEMFQRSDLKLHLLHVVHEPVFAESARAEDYLEWLAGQTSARAGTVTSEVVEGRPDEEIARIAGERDVDLIVIGTHGYTGIGRFVIGSVAEKVMRHTPRPLMLVRPAR